MGIFCLSCIVSCSVKNKLPKGTYLYNGAKVKVVRIADNKSKVKPISSSLEKISTPQTNKMILGYPYAVAMWYAIGEPKKQKGFKHWLRNQLGEPPVLNTTVDVKANALNMQAYLENKGFFKSSVSGGKEIKGYKMTAIYTAKVPQPYSIDSVKWTLDSSELSKDLLKMKNNNSFIKVGEQFDLDNIKAERIRIDLYLKRKGYYYFSPDFIKTYADTNYNNHKLKLYYTIKKDIPTIARFPETIGSITIFPNYTLVLPPPDTAKFKSFMYDSVYIRDTVNNFKPSALVRPLTYKPGSLYDIDTHNESLNRFINEGVFKFVKSRYQPSKDTIAPRKMDVYYYLTPTKKKNIDAEIGGFSKSNSFKGGQASLNWRDRNIFRGAELLNIKTYGAFETSSNDTLSKNNDWRVGGEVSLTFPKLVTPFHIKESNYFPPFTKFTIGYEWERRQLLYTKNFFRLQYDLNWKEQNNMQHTLAPISISFTTTSDFSTVYQQQVDTFPVLQYANRPEIVIGSFYTFVYNSVNPKAPNIYYFSANIDLAGNIEGLIYKPDTAFSRKIVGGYFAEYTKFDFDFRYSRRLNTNTYLANRIDIGIGTPYGNSAYIPFARQFIIGGSNSLRGFSPRQLGPGRVITTAEQQIAYPQIGGDYKLEAQSELRFPFIGKLRGALFVDAGNIWTKTSLLYGDAGRLTSHFMRDIAVDGGLGLRLDISILVVRLDVGIPLREPWQPYGQEWVLSNLGSPGWVGDNLVFNIGIGYPF